MHIIVKQVSEFADIDVYRPHQEGVKLFLDEAELDDLMSKLTQVKLKIAEWKGRKHGHTD